VCGRPIYLLDIAENLVKNKLLTLDLKYFESNRLAESEAKKRFSSEIELGLYGFALFVNGGAWNLTLSIIHDFFKICFVGGDQIIIWTNIRAVISM
jgi:hypothetical protein